MTPFTLDCTPEQARMVVQYQAALEQASAHLTLIITTLSVGLVPLGAVLQTIDTDSGTLTFYVEQHRDSIAPVIPGASDAD